jgi:glycosyltransferase involved in cell wall biosynthesis
MNPSSPERRHPQRVLMTADTVGGVWTYAIDLCGALARYDTHVVLLSMGRMPDDAQLRQISELANVTLIPTEYRLEWMPDCEADLRQSGEVLLALEQEFQPDVVHLNTYWHASLPLHSARLVAAHSCVTSWWKACRGTFPPDTWSQYQHWIRTAVQAADILVAPSAAYLREFQSHHGSAARWRLIPNGRDNSLFRTGPKSDLILAAGRLWDEAKNIRLLCEAAHGVEMPIAIAGDPAGPNGEVAPRENVAFLGKLAPDELATWMARASIFVAPTKYEPFGLTILEAALSGCALVLGNIATLRELWDGAAVFVDPTDAGELRSVLRDLGNDPTKVTSLGANAHARAAHYSLTRMARSYDQTYRALAASRLEDVA